MTPHRRFTCAITLSPDDPALAFGALCLLLTFDNDSACGYQQALVLANCRPFVHGPFYYWLSRYDEAVVAYDQAASLADDPALALYGRANVYYEQGDYTTALADLNASIRYDDQYADAWLLRAWVYLMTGSPDSHADFLRWLELTDRRCGRRWTRRWPGTRHA
jgi:tetratricopeptide (TPR) repeat protein